MAEVGDEAGNPGDPFAVLRAGAVVEGLSTAGPVRLVDVDRITANTAQVVYRDPSGALAEKQVSADDMARVRAVRPGAAFTFDADPVSFWLAAEARRMELAHLFDPQAALGTSDVQPLPHQLRAVYEVMLPKQPLRFVLAHDPGAGKTIMAGLLAKELLARGDAYNVLVVAPGSLVDQWQEEMDSKFGLRFQVLTRERVLADANPFAGGGLWLARMDMLARNGEGVLDRAAEVDWDLVVVDEAHKLSASVWSGEVKKTRRYVMVERLGTAKNLLLMTATPHSGKEEQFQFFMGLLDSDRFEGAPREGTRRAEVADLLQRVVKEDLLTFDGTPLFPPRHSYTAMYELSPPEQELYADVTEYVRQEMNRADMLAGNRRSAVGFALTTLQRRLASSPAAILRSLERRQARLTEEAAELRAGMRRRPGDELPRAVLADLDGDSDYADLAEDLPDAEVEELEDEAAAGVTSAQTLEELEHEIAVVAGLAETARRVVASGSYAKWDKLKETLDEPELKDPDGGRRKVIIFTEHRDTLDDLAARLRNYLGRDDAVVTIHGGVRREERRRAQEVFRTDPDCVFLVATDAAGEGVNLQNAYLVINFDLPWNPNRIEQRFGRVHRIGQTKDCHMWSLVAADTREGAVYQRLLEKLAQQRTALDGQVFDVLGAVFEGTSLRDLMIEAVRYGDDPQRQQYLLQVVDEKVAEGIPEALRREQLVPTGMDLEEVAEIRREMERAQAARLVPHHVESFFQQAFTAAGGTLRPREQRRFEIRSVPTPVKEQDRMINRGTPVVGKYERVTFDPGAVTVADHQAQATLLHPGHPLMRSLISVTMDSHGKALQRGAVMVHHADPATAPYVIALLEHDITEAPAPGEQPRVVSRRAQFMRIDPNGTITPITGTPLPDLDPATPHERELAEQVIGQDWAKAADLERQVIRNASATVAAEHAREVTARVQARVDKTRKLVRDRLTSQANYWDRRASELREQERAGRKTRLSAQNAQERADTLARRMDRRMQELDREEDLSVRPPRVTGAALVLPQGWLDARTDPQAAATHAKETARVDRLAVDAVLAVEHALGHVPVEMPHNNPGYDIESDTPDGLDFIEVKGRVAGAADFVMTRTEITHALNKGPRSVLALVEVADDNTTRVRYLRNPITTPPDPRSKHTTFPWADFWNDGEEMHP